MYMNVGGKMDARVRYTRRVIKESFLELLKEKELSKITVKGICEKAEINRATFYKYYDNPYHLLEMLEEEQLDKLLEDIEKSKAKTLQDIFRVILIDIKENFEIYSVIFSENGDDSFRKKMFAVCYKDNMDIIHNLFPGMPADQQEWLFYFLAEGSNGVLWKWMQDGMERPIDDPIVFVEKIIEDINKTLPSYF